jgi:sterol desaturase/sphingolipid hydroxylase (fatty acid hydroxylase superfamily)
MPPLPALIILSFFFGLFYLIMGNAVFAFLPAFELGYFMYSIIHYGIHAKKAPKRLAHLWKHHNLHHFKYPEQAFGVSSILWDLIFKTMPPRPHSRQKTIED